MSKKSKLQKSLCGPLTSVVKKKGVTYTHVCTDICVYMVTFLTNKHTKTHKKNRKAKAKCNGITSLQQVGRTKGERGQGDTSECVFLPSFDFWNHLVF